MKQKRYFRMVVGLSLALAVFVSLLVVTPVMLCYGQGYGGGGGGGGGATKPYPGLTVTGSCINYKGKCICEEISGSCDNNLWELTIYRGTIALDGRGVPLSSIFIFEEDELPAAPPDFTIVGRSCDFKPKGATFDPPATITFTYDEDLLPEGFNEENLVIAMWDEDAGLWFVLDSFVDPDKNIIIAYTGHFTIFAALAGIAPAAFTVSGLTISPAEVGIGETVTISVVVANTGDLSGSYEVALKIDDVVIETQEVTLAYNTNKKVTFTIAKDVVDTYNVEVNGLTGIFVVCEAPAPPPPPPPTPTPEPPLPPVINWYIIGGIIAGCIIVGVVIWLVVRPRPA